MVTRREPKLRDRRRLSQNARWRRECPRISTLLSRIGDKWTVLVVMLLRAGPRRFSELKREIGGISQRMLTSTLRGLERDGLVTRTVYPTTPPRVDYELTRLGHALREPVEALGKWALAHLDVIDRASTIAPHRVRQDLLWTRQVSSGCSLMRLPAASEGAPGSR